MSIHFNHRKRAATFAAGLATAFLFSQQNVFAEPAKASKADDGKIHWVENFEVAKKTAATESKDMLIDFTGSDWCGWCIRLRQEVFEQDAFQTASKNYVFVELDYPNEKPQTVELKKQNERLKTMFAISGYPSIFLADSKGLPYAKTGYQEGGPEKYLAHMDELKQIKTKRDDAWKEANAATGPAKAKLLATGLDAMDVDLVVQHYKPVFNEIKKLDPQDESGAVTKYGFIIDLAAAHDRLDKVQGGPGPIEAKRVTDKLIESNPKITAVQKQDALMGILNYCAAPKDYAFVVKLMDDVAKLDPESDPGKRAVAIKKSIEKKTGPATPAPVLPGGTIDSTNLDALTAAKGKSVVVEGEVVSTTPTNTGGHMNVQLTPSDSGMLLFIRQPQLEALNKKHDGDFAKAVKDHRIRVRGVLENYGGKDTRLKGKLQIVIKDAGQVELLKDTPATQPAQ